VSSCFVPIGWLPWNHTHCGKYDIFVMVSEHILARLLGHLLSGRYWTIL